MSIDKAWTTWRESQGDDDFDNVMKEANPIIDKAITTYAPNSSPSVRSQGRILAAKAIKSFDPAGGTKLQTYMLTQLQPLRREANSYTSVHAPERVRMDLSKLKTMQRQYFDEKGRDPNDDELADFTGLSRKRIGHLRKFDKKVYGEGTFEETGDSGTGAPQTSEAVQLWEDYVYSELGPIDKQIYEMKIGRNGRPAATTSEIARKLKITAGAVSQRLGKIANKIAEGKELEQQYGKPI